MTTSTSSYLKISLALTLRASAYFVTNCKDGLPFTEVKRTHWTPGRPGKPIDTTPPTVPTLPTNATLPKAPTNATLPTVPTNATLPTIPTDATVPTKPTLPVVPTDETLITVSTKPTLPTVPTDATLPTVPTDATLPTVPTDATFPTVPTDATLPTVPTDATLPTVPTDATLPTVPTDATLPTVPTDATLPTLPTKPTLPTLPTLPTEPEVSLPRYFHTSESFSWKEGITYCENNDARLATLKTQEQHHAAVHYIDRNTGGGTFWIGGWYFKYLHIWYWIYGFRMNDSFSKWYKSPLSGFNTRLGLVVLPPFEDYWIGLPANQTHRVLCQIG